MLNYYSFSKAQYWKLFASILAVSVFSLLYSSVFAQAVPVRAYYQPSNFGDGDEISLHVKIGSSNQQMAYTHGLQLKIPYDLFEIDPFSEPDLYAGGMSWFGGDGNYFGNHSIDHEKKEITINLFRSNGVPVSGYGYTASMYGIIVEMEEIYGKKQIEPGKVVLASIRDVKANMGVTWTFSENEEKILVQNMSEFPVKELKLFSLSGQLIAEKTGDEDVISTSQLAPQVYILHVATGQGSFSEKLMIR